MGSADMKRKPDDAKCERCGITLLMEDADAKDRCCDPNCPKPTPIQKDPPYISASTHGY